MAPVEKKISESIGQLIAQNGEKRETRAYFLTLSIRIKDYLQNNRGMSFLDLEHMARTLYDEHPEYQRKKYRAFKTLTKGTFQHLKTVMNQKEDLNTCSDATASTNDVEASVTNGKVAKPKRQIEQVEVVEEEDEIQVIEPEEDQTPSRLKNDIIVARQRQPAENEFERIKRKAALLASGSPLPPELKSTVSTPAKKDEGKKKRNVGRPSRKPGSYRRDQSGNLVDNQTQGNGDSNGKKNASEGFRVSEMAKNDGESNVTPGNEMKGEIVLEVWKGDTPSSSEAHMTPTRSNEASLTPTCSNVASLTPTCSSEASVNVTISKKTKRPSNDMTDDVDPTIEAVAKEKKVVKKRKTAHSASGSGRSGRNFQLETSSTRFRDFGGSEHLLYDICTLLAHLKHPEVYRELGVTPPRGFLLHGPPGCGKTLLAHAIVGELELPLLKVAAPELVSGVSGDSESKIRELFEEAENNAPCVLFIDEIDSIAPKREKAQREMERRIVAQLLSCLDNIGKANVQVVVIGATSMPDSLDPALRLAGRFDREIPLGIPDRQARENILNILCRDMRLSQETTMAYIASLTPGYVGADLSSLVREAAMSAVARALTSLYPTLDQQPRLEQLLEWLKDSKPVEKEKLAELCIQPSDWQVALKSVQPSSKREGFATVPNISWEDIGALSDIREELQISILGPVRYQDQFESLGLPSSSGVLLVGPPGCGKTLVAKAIANEAGINFISVKGPELLNMYVGESERAVRSCFQRARTSAPCVIFFDEIDSLCPKRSSGKDQDGGSSSRVVNQLLTEMDGMEIRKGVFLMAATNRPDILDPAVLRPGRLDKILYVGFPSQEDRVDILKAITKKGTKPQLEDDISLKTIGHDGRCDGFSGADMTALVREASMCALKDCLKGGLSQVSYNGKIVVRRRHFEAAFGNVRPSVSSFDRSRYIQMGYKYGTENQKKRMNQVLQGPGNVDAEKEDSVRVQSPTIFGEEDRLGSSSPKEPLDHSEDREPDCQTDMDLDQSEKRVENPGDPLHESDADNIIQVNEVHEQEEDGRQVEDMEHTSFDQSEPKDDSNSLNDSPSNCLEKTTESVGSNETDVSMRDPSHEESGVQSDEGRSTLPDLDDDNAEGLGINNNTVAEDAEDSSKEGDNLLSDAGDNCESSDGGDLENRSEVVVPKDADSLSRGDSDSKDVDSLSKDDSDSKDADSLSKGDIDSKDVDSKSKDNSEKPRYLMGMRVSISSSCKVPSAGGKTGVITKMRKNNQQVNVKLDAPGFSQRIIDIASLEPCLPTVGDSAKLLGHGDPASTFTVQSLDSDNMAHLIDEDGNERAVNIGDLCQFVETD